MKFYLNLVNPLSALTAKHKISTEVNKLEQSLTYLPPKQMFILI